MQSQRFSVSEQPDPSGVAANAEALPQQQIQPALEREHETSFREGGICRRKYERTAVPKQLSEPFARSDRVATAVLKADLLREPPDTAATGDEWDQTRPDWEIDVELCQEGGQTTLPFDVERRREREWKGKKVVFRKIKTCYMKQFDVETEMSGQADACAPGRRDRGLTVSERPSNETKNLAPRLWSDLGRYGGGRGQDHDQYNQCQTGKRGQSLEQDEQSCTVHFFGSFWPQPRGQRLTTWRRRYILLLQA